MQINSQELKDYINSVLTSVQNGVTPGFHLSGPIEFNLAVTNTRSGEGGLKVYVAKAEGKLKTEEISHIKFEVRKDVRASVYTPKVTPRPYR